MSVADLKAAIRHFQYTYGKPESVVGEMFEATSDRLWALTSKDEGTLSSKSCLSESISPRASCIGMPGKTSRGSIGTRSSVSFCGGPTGSTPRGSMAATQRAETCMSSPRAYVTRSPRVEPRPRWWQRGPY